MAEVHAALEGAELALERGDAPAALVALLRAWAQLRAPSLAELIESLSEHLGAELQGPSGKSIQARQEAWLERAAARDPLALERLLPSVAEASSRRALERLRAIADQVPDPRIASRAIALIHAPPFVSGPAGKFWTLLYRLLVASADPRALERLRELDARAPAPNTDMGERLAHIRGLNIRRMEAELARLELEPDAASAQAIARLHVQVQELRARVDLRGPQLLAAIYAMPEQRIHREVYADFLLGRGDSRGEFIALQLAAADTPPSRQVKSRMKALLEEHGAAWLGPLDYPLTRDRLFRCGFLARARMKLSPTDIEAIAHEPAWRTVEALDNAPTALLAELCDSPVLRSLAFDDPLGYALLASELVLPRVEELELRFMATWRTSSYRPRSGGFHSQFRTALSTTRALPELKQLRLISDYDIDSDALDWLWDTSLVAGLAQVELRIERPHIAQRLAEQLPPRLAQASSTLAELVVRSGRTRRVFRRDAEGLLSPPD